MSEFRVVIATGGGAFNDEHGRPETDEVSRILRKIAERVEYEPSGVVLDVNGNTVGRFDTV